MTGPLSLPVPGRSAGTPPGRPCPRHRHGVLLAVAATATVLTHWLRLLPLGRAAPGATRWEDWADLLTPYLVGGPLLAALAVLAVSRRRWAVALTGAAAFVQGHGVHLSANSIAHARGSAAPVHLWDETVGHALWFSGLAVLVGTAVGATSGAAVREVPVVRPRVLASAGLVLLVPVLGITWAANVVEGGTAALGSVLAAGLVMTGLRAGNRPGRLLAASAAVSLVLVAGWGAWWGGWPEPSALGWL